MEQENNTIEPNSSDPTKNELDWALFSHLSAIIAGVVGPLIIWVIKKGEMPFAEDQAKECLNFMITVSIAYIICFVLSFVLIGTLLFPVVVVGQVVLNVMAALKVKEGVAYRYPFTIRLVS